MQQLPRGYYAVAADFEILFALNRERRGNTYRSRGEREGASVLGGVNEILQIGGHITVLHLGTSFHKTFLPYIFFMHTSMQVQYSTRRAICQAPKRYTQKNRPHF